MPIFFVLWLGYKLIFKTRVILPKEVDIVTGLRAIDEEEEQYLEYEKAKGPQGRFEKIWDAL